MDIELARTFLAIVPCGSFIAAADQLCMPQTAVTARVKTELSADSDTNSYLGGVAD